MEKFYRSCVGRLIDAIRHGDPDGIQHEIDFCQSWGGGPLEAAALVAQAWLQERNGCTDQASGQLCLGDEVHPHRGVPWDPVEPLPPPVSTQEYDGKTRPACQGRLGDEVHPRPAEQPASRGIPQWAKSRLQQQRQQQQR